MKRYLMTFLTAIMTLCCAGAVFPLPSSGNSHDIASLHAWGPYSKRYAGISHIPDMRKGIRFDFSVMPGYYRNRQLVPHVLFESSYFRRVLFRSIILLSVGNKSGDDPHHLPL